MKNYSLMLLIIFIAMLGACGRSTPSNFYLLESSLGLIQATDLPKTTMRIAQVEVPGYLNRNNIVSRVAGQTKLILAEFHLWAEPVANGVHRVVEETLTPPLLSQGITVLPATSESNSDYTLILDLQRLDGNFNEKAVLECRWTLLNKDDKAVERGIFAQEEMVNGADYNVLVAAESKLLRDFGQYLAKRLPTLMQEKVR